MIQVIPTTGILQYEQFGFTNCVRFKDVLYLSGIGAIDIEGKVLGDDIETQTVYTYDNIGRVLRAAGSGLDQILADDEFRRGSGSQRIPLCRGAKENPDLADLY